MFNDLRMCIIKGVIKTTQPDTFYVTCVFSMRTSMLAYHGVPENSSPYSNFFSKELCVWWRMESKRSSLNMPHSYYSRYQLIVKVHNTYTI